MTTIRKLTKYLLCFIFLIPIIFSFSPLSGTVGSWQVKTYAQQAEPEQQPESEQPETEEPPPQPQPEAQEQPEEPPQNQSPAQEQPETEEPPPQDGIPQEQPPAQEQPEQQPEGTTPQDGQSQAQDQSNSQPQNGGNNTGGCLIATAAFGSELSPQVQFLRNFRDDYILSTVSGSSFMNVFNTWYYSFSPYVANYERANPWFQQTVKISIYPLLGILQLSEKAYWYMDDDYGSLTAGLVASSLIGSIYLSPFMLLSRRIRKTELGKKFVVIVIATVILAVFAVFASLSYANELALMITTSILVLTTIAVSSIFAARGLVYVGKLIQRTKSQFLAIH